MLWLPVLYTCGWGLIATLYVVVVLCMPKHLPPMALNYTRFLIQWLDLDGESATLFYLEYRFIFVPDIYHYYQESPICYLHLCDSVHCSYCFPHLHWLPLHIFRVVASTFNGFFDFSSNVRNSTFFFLKQLFVCQQSYSEFGSTSIPFLTTIGVV